MVYADEQAVLHQAAEAVLDVRRGEEMRSFRFPAKDGKCSDLTVLVE
jgi:hypothetical protein